jgi:hypothetical protein
MAAQYARALRPIDTFGNFRQSRRISRAISAFSTYSHRFVPIRRCLFRTSVMAFFRVKLIPTIASPH